MEWAEVLKRIEAGENRTTEFGRDLSKQLGPAICAFANGDGGLVILGVDDSGSVGGLAGDPREAHEWLTSFLQTGCNAPVWARCGRQEVGDNRWVHWLEVPRIRGPEPLRYGRRYYIRRERGSVEPSPCELQELFNLFGIVLAEWQIIQAAGVGDIDIEEFRSFQHRRGIETEEEPRLSDEDDLRNACVVAEDGRALHPTLYGLMVFGKSPQTHPQTGSFWIKCAAYAGADRASGDILVGDAKGRLVEQTQRALGWMEALGRTETYDGVFRQERPLIPRKALREALVNAVAHRDYALTGASVMLEVFSDRVEVTSPGTLPYRMTPETVKKGSPPRSRNEWMATAMVDYRLMKRRGRGWPLMRREMRDFNGTEPELVNSAEGKFVRVTFRLRPS